MPPAKRVGAQSLAPYYAEHGIDAAAISPVGPGAQPFSAEAAEVLPTIRARGRQLPLRFADAGAARVLARSWGCEDTVVGNHSGGSGVACRRAASTPSLRKGPKPAATAACS